MKIGITGQSGFIGTNLYRAADSEHAIDVIQFRRSYFNDPGALRSFVRECDAIVHLAGITRHTDPVYLYETNLLLCKQLVSAMALEDVRPHVLFASSVFEFTNTPYGKAKVACRRLFEDWATEHGGSFAGCVFPNVYGPGSRPFYCSFIANFAYQISHGLPIAIHVDRPVDLIYVDHLSRWILRHLRCSGVTRPVVEPDFTITVSGVAELFREFARTGGVPDDKIGDANVGNLYTTYRYFAELE